MHEIMIIVTNRQ